jgi:hypothetical protein
VVIRLKEIPIGFRVLSAEAASIDSLPHDASHSIRENVFHFQTDRHEDVICNVMCVVEAIDEGTRVNLHTCYGFGLYSNLASIQEDASSLNRVDLIHMLNNEV